MFHLIVMNCHNNFTHEIQKDDKVAFVVIKTEDKSEEVK